jgi:starvation-inducible DNA-binding protein
MTPLTVPQNRNSRGVAGELTKILSDEYTLYAKTRNIHWNVECDEFSDKHKFFENQYQQFDLFIDHVAARIRSLGKEVPSVSNTFESLPMLPEPDCEKRDKRDFIHELLEDHEQVIQKLQGKVVYFNNAYKDSETGTLIEALIRDHQKMIAFLHKQL